MPIFSILISALTLFKGTYSYEFVIGLCESSVWFRSLLRTEFYFFSVSVEHSAWNGAMGRPSRLKRFPMVASSKQYET